MRGRGGGWSWTFIPQHLFAKLKILVLCELAPRTFYIWQTCGVIFQSDSTIQWLSYPLYTYKPPWCDMKCVERDVKSNTNFFYWIVTSFPTKFIKIKGQTFYAFVKLYNPSTISVFGSSWIIQKPYFPRYKYGISLISINFLYEKIVEKPNSDTVKGK